MISCYWNHSSSYTKIAVVSVSITRSFFGERADPWFVRLPETAHWPIHLLAMLPSHGSVIGTRQQSAIARPGFVPSKEVEAQWEKDVEIKWLIVPHKQVIGNVVCVLLAIG